MVIIRLSRGGAKQRPFYHIVVADRRYPRDGRFLDNIGFFNPLEQKEEARLRIDVERLNYWTQRGAKPTERVASLVKTLRSGRTTPATE